MNKLKSMRWLIPAIYVVMLMSCEDNFTTRDQPGVVNGKTFGGRGSEGPGGYTDHPNGDRYPYPQVIKKEFIPPYSKFDYMKCLAWRITWPAYAGSADINKIPTVFTTNGALNSFYYLNTTDPQNTYNAKFSIYYDSRVVSASNLWDELDYSFDAPDMESVYFAKVDFTPNVVEYWATERPQLFEENWPGSDGQDLEYEAGDFFIFNLTDQMLYGGIRIVSMSPRIIEVYLAVPND
jgi:hypothetical protein